MTDPTKRSVAGMFLVLALIALWAIVIASLSAQISRLPFALEMLVYFAAGVAWIFPAMPIMRWIATGRWRAPARD